MFALLLEILNFAVVTVAVAKGSGEEDTISHIDDSKAGQSDGDTIKNCSHLHHPVGLESSFFFQNETTNMNTELIQLSFG